MMDQILGIEETADMSLGEDFEEKEDETSPEKEKEETR